MTDEVREYAERKVWESGIRMVSGHYPEFKSKKQVDNWIDMWEVMFIEGFELEHLPEIKSIDVQKYKDLLWRLKRNEDNVPREILLIKHGPAYNSLRRELKGMTEAIVREIVQDGLLIERNGSERCIQRINEAVDQSGLLNQISKAVYQEKCYGGVIASIMELRNLVHGIVEEIR